MIEVPSPIERGQLAHNVEARGGVQIAGRLVRHDDGRLCRHGACDSNALLLAAGHLTRAVIHALSPTEQRVSGKPSALLPADAAVNERQLDVLDRCQRRN